MNSLKKHLTRSTQKIKRTVSTSHQHKDAEYDLLQESVKTQERTLSNFDKHIVELVKHLEAEMNLTKNFALDYKMIYANPASHETQDDLEVVRELQMIAEKHEREIIKPFTEKCQQRVQQPIRDFLQELNEATRGLSKQRHNLQLDYEYQKGKFNSVSSKTSSTPQQIEEARNMFEAARIAFDEVDEQVKQRLREVAVKRYTVFHPLVSELFGEIMAEYYEQLGSLALLMRQMRRIVAPEQREVISVVHHSETVYPESVTRTTTSTTTSVGPPRVGSFPIPPTTLPKHIDVEWYWLTESNEQQGPSRVQELKSLKTSGQISGSTFVCCDGMSNWQTIDELELKNYL